MDSDDIPLYHIDGTQNIADLLTKPHLIGVEDVSSGSQWQGGHEWMKVDLEKMPVRVYSDLTVPQMIEDQDKSECYDHLLDPTMEPNPTTQHQIFSIIADEAFVSTVAVGRSYGTLLVDPIYHGWLRALRIISNMLSFVSSIKHAVHRPKVMDNCYICTNSVITESEAELVLLRYETCVIRSSLPFEKLKQFSEHNGILYYQSRLTEENPFRVEDLDKIPFLDLHEFTGKVPVVLADSRILYAYLIYLHTRVLSHAGVEITMKSLSKKFKVRGLIKRIKKDCSRCTLILKKTS